MTTIYAPWVNLVTSTMTSTSAVKTRADAVDDPGPVHACAGRRRVGGVRSSRVQCRTMPAWLRVNETNTPMMYSWMSRVVLASNAQISSAGERGQDDDAVAEHQPVAAPGELRAAGSRPRPRMRGQDREAVERGVRGQHQDRRGERLHQVEADASRAEHRAGRAAR